MTYSEDQIDNARGLSWSSKDDLRLLFEFIRWAFAGDDDERDALYRQLAIDFIEERRPR